MHIEKLVDKKTLHYQNFCCGKIPNKYNRYYRISKVYLAEIDDYIITNDYTKQIEDYKDFPVCNFNFYGGVLADEIGLGKTFSMIALIKLQNKMHSPSLIYVLKEYVCNGKRKLIKQLI
jgi:SNF2 family DNA or RNA helicase